VITREEKELLPLEDLSKETRKAVIVATATPGRSTGL